MKTVFEIYLKYIGYNIKKSLDYINRLQSLSPDLFHSWQKKRKWEISRFHYNNNQLYKKKVGRSFPDKWEDLPMLEKSDYQNKLDYQLSRGYTTENTYIANTSGSSGHPFFFAKNKESHAFTWAYKKLRYKGLGLSFSDLEARFYGIPLNKKDYLKEKIKDSIMIRKRFIVFDLSDSILEKYYKSFLVYKFSYIYGYNNSIVMFARYILKKKYDFKKDCKSVKIVIVTSEICTKWDRLVMEEAFKVPIVSEYGASEVGYIGSELKPNVWMVAKENVFLENGKNGNILVTSLHNKAMPFIRYNIGDIGQIDYDIDGYQLINGLKGRENDSILLPSGKVCAGLTFYYISRSILENSSNLKEFIIRQTSLNTFVFDIVSEKPIGNLEKIKIQQNMDEYLEPGLKLIINRFDKLKREKSGKLKHFSCEIN